jgi:zinc protease
MLKMRTTPSRNDHSAKAVFIFFVVLGMALSPSVTRGQKPDPPQKQIFENGLTVISQKDDSSAITILEILVKGGKQSELPGQEGLSYLATRLALEIPDRASVQEVMEKSARTMMTSRGDYSFIHLECLSEYLDPILKIVSGILKEPLFSSIRVSRITGVMSEQAKIESDDNMNVGHLALLRTFLKGRGYSGSIFGEESSLKKLKSREIETYYKASFTPGNMILASVSDLDSEHLTAVLKKYFGDLKPQKTPPSPATSRTDGRTGLELPEKLIEKDSAQTLISSGYALPPLTEKNYTLAVLAESLLGRGPGSRLWPLRTERKLAYNVNAKATVMKGGGLIEAYLETDPAKAAEARDALTSALREVWAHGVTPDELQVAKTFARADFLRGNEPKSNRTETLGSFEALGLGFEYFSRYLEDLNAVTLDEINIYLQTILDPANEATVIVGRKT